MAFPNAFHGGRYLIWWQVKRLVNRVVTQFVCRYCSLRYNRQEGTEPGPDEEPLGMYQIWGGWECSVLQRWMQGSCFQLGFLLTTFGPAPAFQILNE